MKKVKIYGCLSTKRFIPVKFKVIWNSLDYKEQLSFAPLTISCGLDAGLYDVSPLFFIWSKATKHLNYVYSIYHIVLIVNQKRVFLKNS
jgi:hypothetical protein